MKKSVLYRRAVESSSCERAERERRPRAGRESRANRGELSGATERRRRRRLRLRALAPPRAPHIGERMSAGAGDEKKMVLDR